LGASDIKGAGGGWINFATLGFTGSAFFGSAGMAAMASGLLGAASAGVARFSCLASARCASGVSLAMASEGGAEALAAKSPDTKMAPPGRPCAAEAWLVRFGAIYMKMAVCRPTAIVTAPRRSIIRFCIDYRPKITTSRLSETRAILSAWAAARTRAAGAP